MIWLSSAASNTAGGIGFLAARVMTAAGFLQGTRKSACPDC